MRLRNAFALGLVAAMLTACSPYVYVDPRWEPAPYPPNEPYPYPGFPPVGYESNHAVAIAFTARQVVAAMEYASRAYPHYSVTHRVEYANAPHMYDVWVNVYGGPTVEVYKVRVNTYLRSVQGVQTFHDYGPHRWPGGGR